MLLHKFQPSNNADIDKASRSGSIFQGCLLSFQHCGMPIFSNNRVSVGKILEVCSGVGKLLGVWECPNDGDYVTIKTHMLTLLEHFLKLMVNSYSIEVINYLTRHI